MKFIFKINQVGTIPTVGVSYIQGTLAFGDINIGDTAFIEGNPKKSVTINSVALVKTTPHNLLVLTLSIAPINFPITELAGCRLIGN